MGKIKKLVKIIVQIPRRRHFKSCGKDVSIGKKCRFIGNIELGSHISIGRGANFVSTMANIKIHDFVVLGPNVTIYSGDHATDIVGKHICEVTDADKMAISREKQKATINHGEKDLVQSAYDKDVVIESGCWIGTRVIILKGVTIGRGSVIGAGAIVTKDVPAYSIYVGSPPTRIFPRFNDKQIIEHEKMLAERGVQIR